MFPIAYSILRELKDFSQEDDSLFQALNVPQPSSEATGDLKDTANLSMQMANFIKGDPLNISISAINAPSVIKDRKVPVTQQGVIGQLTNEVSRSELLAQQEAMNTIE